MVILYLGPGRWGLISWSMQLWITLHASAWRNILNSQKFKWRAITLKTHFGLRDYSVAGEQPTTVRIKLLMQVAVATVFTKCSLNTRYATLIIDAYSLHNNNSTFVMSVYVSLSHQTVEYRVPCLNEKKLGWRDWQAKSLRGLEVFIKVVRPSR